MKPITKLSQEYLVRLLNLRFFEKTLTWEGEDLFDSLPVMFYDEEPSLSIYPTTMRGCMLVNIKDRRALRVLVTLEDAPVKKTNYRISNLVEPHKFDKLKVYPYEGNVHDWVVSDITLGSKMYNNKVFYDLNDSEGKLSRVSKLISFVLESEIYTNDDKKLFEDLIDSPLSVAPVSGDTHFVII